MSLAGIYQILIDMAPEHLFRSRKWIPGFVLSLLLMVIVLHALGPVSVTQAHYALATVKASLAGAFMYTNKLFGASALTAQQNALLAEMPLDVRTALKHVPNLEPSITTYATCPTCCCIYRPDSSQPHDPYPRVCTFIETDKGPCSTPLVKRHVESNGKVVHRPIKTFGYQNAFAWIATLLARPGLDPLLESAWRPSSQTPSEGIDDRWRDIWDAPAIQEFMGPDGKTRFSVQTNGSVHLVFSLFVDWFNPFGNKKAGKSHSLGAIYMACLNLPPHLRYLEYVGKSWWTRSLTHPLH